MQPSSDISKLLEIMSRLRDPVNGCPWDIEQSFASIAPYTVEEAYEVADAIERGDMDDLRLELGDLLLQSVYHAQMASEAGHFDFGDVVEGITAKMIRRHPHVFGTEDVTAEEYSAKGMEEGTWERIKAEEKSEAEARRAKLGLPSKHEAKSYLDDVPFGLPALTAALKLQKRASKVGFDWNDVGAVLAKVREETEEFEQALESQGALEQEEEIGDLLFVLVNLCRHLKIDPENALRRCNAKFKRRFAYIESALKSSGQTLQDATLEQMDRLWDEAKSKAKTA
ncbi:MAG: nucleoside triphosphate pyrophosphohydrolase [Rhizobiaceae bacterium]|nr:nucleoside triphosphate pyrophosphohydrolase [Rhizobiaceae bacterium]